MAGAQHTRLKLVTCLLLLAACCFQAYSGPRVENKCLSFAELGLPPPGGGLQHAHACPSVAGWKRVFLLWAPIEVAVSCSHAAYKVITAGSQAELEGPDAPSVLWCGWRNILNEPNACRFELSALQNHYFATKPTDAGLFSIPYGQRQLNCTVSAQTDASARRLYWMLATLGGVLLFFSAASLSSSIYFRVSSGALLFASGFMVVLLFVTMRSMPYKRTFAAAFAVSTSSLLALVRWAYGTWWPGIQPLLHSRLVVGYLAASCLVGAAVTYWLDDPANQKMMTTIRVGLQLAGLGVVYRTIADEPVALGAVVALALSHAIFAALSYLAAAVAWVARRLLGRWQHKQQQQGRGAQAAGRRSAAADGVSLVCSEDDYQQQSGLLAAGSGHAQGRVDANEEDSEDDEEESGSLLASDEEEEQLAAPAAPGDSRWWWGRRPAAAVPAPAAVLAPAAAAVPAGNSGGGAFKVIRYTPPAPPSPAAPHLAGAGAAAAGWSPPHEVRRLGARTTPQQQQQQQDLGGGVAAGSGSAGRWGASQAVAFDVNNRRTPQQQRTTPQQQQARPTPPSAAAAAAAAASPLGGAGKIRNPDTGRDITVGGPKYNELLSKGYVPDAATNSLVAPAGAAPRASPATNLRRRVDTSKQQSPYSQL